MKRSYDYAIVGAGPAGLSAAARSASFGLSVVLLDEQRHPGGQIYRAVEQGARSGWPSLDPTTGTAGAWSTVFTAREPTTSTAQPSGRSPLSERSTISKKERPDAFRPNACSLQPAPSKGPSRFRGGPFRESWEPALRMCSSSPPAWSRAAGSCWLARGPCFTWSPATCSQPARASPRLLDTRSPQDYIRAARLLPAALPGVGYLIRGLAMHAQILKARVPHFRKISKLRASGQESLTHVTFVTGGRTHALEADRLILHDGVVRTPR